MDPFVQDPDYYDVCESCAVDQGDDDSVQLRDCGHVLCETCSEPCAECMAENE